MNLTRKIITITATTALTFTLCMGLAGCGPSKDNFTGVWKVSTVDGTSVDQLNSWTGSSDMTITLNEDGTASVKSTSSAFLGGSKTDSAKGTWKATSDTECSITDEEGKTTTCKLNGEVLTVNTGGKALTYKRA